MKTGAERKRKSQARVISRASIQGMSRPSRERLMHFRDQMMSEVEGVIIFAQSDRTQKTEGLKV